MELPDLGKQCALKECKQLDFLAFKCTYCSQIFCKNHYLPDGHNCIAQNDSVVPPLTPIIVYKCSKCSSTSAVEMNCPVCKKHFCLLHRHHGCLDSNNTMKLAADLGAHKKQFDIAKEEVDRQVECKLILAGKKQNKTALKVQMMRLKGKAVGNKVVPTADRVYFKVFLPLSVAACKTAVVFVSRQWTVGRAIDSVSDLCKVPNKNNQKSAAKLRLFHHCNGQPVCNQMDKPLDDLLKQELLIDGESLILEYVNENDDPNFCLKHLDNYVI